MRPSGTFAPARSELDAFLFAPVGLERNGMTLSVLSGLARLGLDPWAEAARLANLPDPAAAEALAGAIPRMSGAGGPPLDAGAIAARLIRLLPRHGGASSPRAADPPPSGRPRPQAPAWLIWLLLAALAVVTLAPLGAALFGGVGADAPISAGPRP